MSNIDPFTQIEAESSPGRSKKRLSSEQLNNASPEKRLRSNKLLSPRRDETENVNPKVNSSPVQRVTVKASMQESPKKSLKSSSLAASLSELRQQYSQYLQIKEEDEDGSCSSESRLNRLNQQYTEQFEIDIEEEQRRKEAEIALEERKKEHLKEQEKERARLIQERIFGRVNSNYKDAKESEEEKIKQLRQRYLGNGGGPKTNVPVPAPVKNHVSAPAPVPAATTPKFQKLEEESSSAAAAKKFTPLKKVIDTNGVSKLQEYKSTVNQIKTANGNITQKNKNTEEEKAVSVKDKKSIFEEKNKSTEDEKVISVRDKKSIFEEKMKLEREAGNKEREANEWLRVRNSRTGSVSDTTKHLNSPKKEVNKPAPVAEVKGKPTPDVNGSDKPTLEKTESSEEKVVSESVATTEKEPLSNSEGIAEQKTLTDSIKNTPTKVASPHIIPKSVSDHSIANFTGDINSPQPVDCTEDTIYSDSRAFDLSSILAIAAHREEAQAHLKPTKTHANRCSTMKVEPFQILQALPELNMTPIKNESEDDDDEQESLSEFAKAIKNKGKTIKGPELKQKLATFDSKFNPGKLVENELKSGESKTSKVEIASKSQKRPDKPPRSHQRKIENPENVRSPVKKQHVENIRSPGRHIDTPTGKSGVRTKKEKHLSTGCEMDVISKPLEKVTRMKMRKSSSFSEGLGSTPVRSGYHRECSERYNACSSDIPDIVPTKNQQIQSLLEEAASQQNIVLQASQALNVAECSSEDKSNSPEVIEGERLLLLATERRTVCLEEVKALKENAFEQCNMKDSDTIQPCKATLGLTDLKLPLNPEFILSLKARKAEIGVFHFVVVVSAGNKNVYSTKVVSTHDDLVDSSLVISNNIVMKNIPHDFTLTLKVFGMHSGQRSSDHITRLKKNSTSKESPGNLKNLFSKKHKDEDYSHHASPQTVFRKSNFKLVGETKFNLSLLGNGLTKYALTKVPSKCPLEGCIQMRVNCKPEFSANVTGFLTILEDVGGYTAWNRRWCAMKDSRVCYWRYPDDEKDQEPIGNIDLRYCSDKLVKVLSRDICARPQTFELTIRRGFLPTDTENLITTIDGKVTRIKYWICCDDKEDRITWMEAVNKQLSDSKAWRLKKISTVKSPVAHQV